MARKPEDTGFGREERDLLIELRTRMSSMQGDIQEMKGSVTARLLNLESNAVSRIIVDDHENRIRALETQRWMIAGGVSVASALGGYILQVFF